jgi:hypothetical protein
MQCPLCAGPLHIEDPARFLCERGHELGPEELDAAVSLRATAALSMAIEALESEALAFRALDTFGRGDSRSALAEAAERDAGILRQLAAAHASPDRAVGDEGTR